MMMKKLSGSSASPDKGKEKSYYGHRERLRDRFMLSTFEGMIKYDVMEILLTIFIPRKDVKPAARLLVDKFGTVNEVLAQPVRELVKIPGIGEKTAIGLKMLHSAMHYCLHERCIKRDLIDNSEAVKNFVRMKMGVRWHESYMLVFLDSHNYLLGYDVLSEGTVDYVFAYLRNAAEEALDRHASKVILVHNHPSGICAPSGEDIEATHMLFASLKTLDIELVDHLIVSRDECFSFTEHKLPLNGPAGK